MTPTEQTEFSAIEIDDIDYQDEDGTNDAIITCGEKLAAMKAKAGISTESAAIVAKSSLSNNSSIWVVAGIAAAAISASMVAVFLYDKKKRRKTK